MPPIMPPDGGKRVWTSAESYCAGSGVFTSFSVYFWTLLDAAGNADGARDRNRTGTPAIHESGGF